MAPLIKAMSDNQKFDIKVCNTGQHKEMLDQVLSFFEIIPDFNLQIMSKSQTLYSITELIINRIKVVLEDFKPDYVFVHGDTSTTMAASLAAFYNGSKICHIEAGLRTNDINTPFPEEANRRITSVLSTYHFAPTEISKNNLIKENISSEKIIVTGNTVIDALFESVDKLKKSTEITSELQNDINEESDIILVTCHRRENYGLGILNLCEALKQLALQNPNVQIIFPVHLNPKIKDVVFNNLLSIKNIKLIEPLSYPNFDGWRRQLVGRLGTRWIAAAFGHPGRPLPAVFRCFAHGDHLTHR